MANTAQARKRVRQDEKMKLQGGISMGNIITIVMLGVSMALAWGNMAETVESLETRIESKSDKYLTDYKFQVIMRDIKEIKELLKEKRDK